MTEKGFNTKLIKPVALSAGIVGFVQAISWTTMSLLCILCYFKVITEDVTHNIGETEYYKQIYLIFLDSDQLSLGGVSVIVSPKEFFIFMWFYLIISAIWTILSGYLIWAIIHGQWQLTKYLFGSWSAITILISIVDVILTSLLGYDYQSLNKDLLKFNESLHPILVSQGIVMAIAARGFVLWIANIVFAIILIKFTVDVASNEKSQAMPIIHGYENNEPQAPWTLNTTKDLWPDMQTDPQVHRNGYANHGYDANDLYASPYTAATVYSNNQNSRDLTRPEPTPVPTSFASPYTAATVYSNNQNSRNLTRPDPTPPPTSFADEIANKVATIGRNKGKRSPVLNVQTPAIPDPDYSPIGRRRELKSVLRSTSHY